MTPRRRRVLLVTQHYGPEQNFITTDVARALSAGCDVEVITTQPNYPSGEVARGFKWYHWRTRTEDGIKVTRVPVFTYRGLNVVWRTLGYLVFALFATLAICVRRPRPDLWLVYQTPFSTAWGVALGRWIWGGSVVHIVADLWPESMLAAGVLREGTLERMVGAARRWTNRRADRLVVTTPGMVPIFAGEGYPTDRMVLVPVWTDAQRGLTPPTVPTAGNLPYVVYAGTIGPSQALGTLIEAMALLRDRGVWVSAKVAGTGAALPALRSAAEQLGPISMEFVGVVSPEEAVRLIRGAVAQVVSLVPDPRFEHTIPSKLYGAIGSGVPILAGLTGDALALAERSGLAVPYSSAGPGALADAIERVLHFTPDQRVAMAAAAWRFYLAELSPDTGLTRLVTLIEQLVPTGDERPTGSST